MKAPFNVKLSLKSSTNYCFNPDLLSCFSCDFALLSIAFVLFFIFNRVWIKVVKYRNALSSSSDKHPEVNHW